MQSEKFNFNSCGTRFPSEKNFLLNHSIQKNNGHIWNESSYLPLGSSSLKQWKFAIWPKLFSIENKLMKVLLKKRNSFSEQSSKRKNTRLIDVSEITKALAHFEINFLDWFFLLSFGDKISISCSNDATE